MSINWRNTIWGGEDFLSIPACWVVKEILSVLLYSLNLFLMVALHYTTDTKHQVNYIGDGLLIH